jgi:basic membrane lipoprotein Med (substrate-binding protein (PBP1-ABC) superfamily)
VPVTPILEHIKASTDSAVTKDRRLLVVDDDESVRRIVAALLKDEGYDTATAGGAAEAKPIKAAWIYVGPHNDGGWSQAHDDGRLYVQKMLGKKVITTYKENVPEGPQTLQVIDALVRDGNTIIFGTSFGFMDAMATAAK